MGNYDYLPVAQECSDFLIEITHIINSFPRDYKYSYGTHIQNGAIQTLSQITTAANYMNKEKKLSCIECAISSLQTVKVLRRICNKLNIVDDPKYLKLASKQVSIEKQLNGRFNSLDKKLKHD